MEEDYHLRANIECIILIFAAVVVAMITFAMVTSAIINNLIKKVKEDCQPRSKMECTVKCVEKCEDEDKRVCMTMPVEECKEVMVMMLVMLLVTR